jgi:hypothetical protein
MIELISRLETAIGERSVWGLTSHYHLNLLAADDSTSPSYVSIAPPASGVFTIEYRMPAAEAPWHNAHVIGETKSVVDAVAMVLVGLERSGGWRAK